MRRIDSLVGKRFGRWSVVGEGEYDGSSYKWQCRCDCGKYRKVRNTTLLSGESTSCGCFAGEVTSKRIRKDITGQRFGNMVVIRDVGNNTDGAAIWLCICDCGTEKVIEGRNLRSGDTKSCGLCIVDLLHIKFDRWTVIELLPRTKKRNQLCKCKCACGTIRDVKSSSLISGKSRSCGCHRDDVIMRQRLLPNNEGQFRYIYRDYEIGAKERGLEWSLKIEDIREIVTQSCYYCGVPPYNRSSVTRRRNKDECIPTSGIDRVDNKQGYTIDNCVPCCRICNWSKRHLPLHEFLDWVNYLRNSKNMTKLIEDMKVRNVLEFSQSGCV